MLSIVDVPVQDGAVKASLADGEAVLVLPSKGQVKVLNEVGTRVWELLDGSRSVAEIIETICSEYQVDSELASADTLGFLAELAHRGLIRVA